MVTGACTRSMARKATVEMDEISGEGPFQHILGHHLLDFIARNLYSNGRFKRFVIIFDSISIVIIVEVFGHYNYI